MYPTPSTFTITDYDLRFPTLLDSTREEHSITQPDGTTYPDALLSEDSVPDYYRNECRSRLRSHSRTSGTEGLEVPVVATTSVQICPRVGGGVSPDVDSLLCPGPLG